MASKGVDGRGLPGEYFTSGSDLLSENKFTWSSANGSIDGQIINWAPGEPSAVNDLGVEEDCIAVSLKQGVMKKNELMDVDCNQKYQILCQVLSEFYCTIFHSKLLFFVKTPIATTTKPPCLQFDCQKDVIY